MSCVDQVNFTMSVTSKLSSSEQHKGHEQSCAEEAVCSATQTGLHWWSSPGQYLKKLATIKDTPHSIALGTAIGVFIGLTPTVGIQMVLVVTLALICRPFFRFNQLAGLIAVYISNPLTTIPMYWAMFKLGGIFTGAQGANQQFQKVLELWQTQGWKSLLSVSGDVFPALIIGSLLMAIPCGLITYPVMRWFLQSWKLRSKPDMNVSEAAELEPGEETTQLSAYETQPLAKMKSKSLKMVSTQS